MTTSDDDLAAQRDMLLDICARLTENNKLVNRLATRRGDHGVDSLLPLMMNIGYTESQLYASGLHEKFNALFESVDSADFAPPQGAREVYAEFCDKLEEYAAAVSGLGV